MRKLSLVLLVIVLTGCMTTIDYPKTAEARCATGGLKYDGFDIAGNVQGRDVGTIKCKVPETKEEECRIVAAQQKVAAAERHNSKWSIRNWAIGFGYMLYVAPGAGLYYLWKDDNEQDYQNFEKLSNEVAKQCATQAVAH